MLSHQLAADARFDLPMLFFEHAHTRLVGRILASELRIARAKCSSAILTLFLHPPSAGCAECDKGEAKYTRLIFATLV